MAEDNEKKKSPVIEIVKKVDDTLDYADHLNKGVKFVAGTQAFRVYSAAAGYGVNKAGNLRGMVKNARWRTIFNYSNEVSEHMENIGTLASFAANIAEMSDDFEKIAHSRNPATLKGLQIAAAAGTAAERTLAGAVPAGVGLIYTSLKGWCEIAGLAGGSVQSGANQCIEVLDNADKLVKQSFKAITDTNNQSKAFWWVVDVTFVPKEAY